MSIRKIFESSAKPNSWGDRFRNKRFEFLSQKLAKLPKPLKILDIGGLESYWINRGFCNNNDYQITILNLEKCDTTCPNFIGVAGDATNLHEIADKEFDIAFSNSVIEHLYSKENQVRMASEVKRVGKYYFIQTPNKYFPIEPHYILPFFQYLPDSLKYFILTKTKLSRLEKWDEDEARKYINEIRLLSYNDFRNLFPESIIYKEMFMGLVKSFTAHNF